MTAALRPYRPGDRDDVYDVCVRTGDAGRDATGKYRDGRLLPDIWAGPYVELEPELATVVDDGERVVGYIVGAADTADFVRRYRQAWLPGFAARHPLPAQLVSDQDRIIAVGHNPDGMIGPDQDRYPAHLHIDLLPEAQGQGLGRALMRRLLGQLRERGVPGVQLGFAPSNSGAGAFYTRLGFHRLPSTPGDPYHVGIETDTVL